TNDVHYLKKEDSLMQRVLICIQTNHTLDEENDLAFETDEFYLKSADEMKALFGDVEGAIENTVKIANRCHFDFEFGNTKLPLFVAPNGMPNDEYFKKLCWEGLKKRYPV